MNQGCDASYQNLGFVLFINKIIRHKIIKSKLQSNRTFLETWFFMIGGNFWVGYRKKKKRPLLLIKLKYGRLIKIKVGNKKKLKIIL